MASTERRSTPPAAPPAIVALDQFFSAGNLFALRSAVAAHGADLGLAERPLADLVLVAHELASNAIRHGGATPSVPARLRLWRDGDTVVCQVSDSGPGLSDPENAGRRRVPISAINGRGLWIARQVARQVAIDCGADGTTVTVRVPL